MMELHDTARAVGSTDQMGNRWVMTAAMWEPQRPMSKELLAEYDSDQYGPLFAVSDEGSAGPLILDAALSSAKAAAGASSPFRLGVILDGERMTSAGEVPIGPPEYGTLSAAAAGSAPPDHQRRHARQRSADRATARVPGAGEIRKRRHRCVSALPRHPRPPTAAPDGPPASRPRRGFHAACCSCREIE